MTPSELLAHEFVNPCTPPCGGKLFHERAYFLHQVHRPWCPQHDEYAAWWKSLMAAYVRAAREMLADPGRCASAGCGGDDGPYYDDTVQRRTVVGALERVIHEALPQDKDSLKRKHEHMLHAEHALGIQCRRIGVDLISGWHMLTHAEILAALDEAIRAMESND